MAIYTIGDVAHLTVEFRDTSNNLADPSAVSILVQAPDGTQATYTSLTSPAVAHDSTGKYSFNLPVSASGVDSLSPAYIYRWIATGTLAATEEGFIVVSPSLLVLQPPPNAPEFTWASLTAIDAAIQSGALEVRFQDRTVTYRSAEELLTLRSAIKQSLVTTGVTPMIRQARALTRSGY